MSLPVFQYQLLPTSRHIRLVKIEDGRHSIATLYQSLWVAWKPKLLIDVYDIDQLQRQHTRYITLSYTWSRSLRSDSEPNAGDEASSSVDPGREIEINGQSLQVTQNLYDALVRLGGLPEPIWIDAICIDQSNATERASQVSMMDEIYGTFGHTLVWLGKDECDVEHLKFVLEHIQPLLKQYWNTNGFVPDRDKFNDPVLLKRIGFTGLRSDWIAAWDGFARFFRRRRYFTRGWILQEFALSEHIVMLCGQQKLPWDDIVSICQFIEKSGWHGELASRAINVHGFDPERPPRKTGDEVNRIESLRVKQEYHRHESILRKDPRSREILRELDPESNGQLDQPVLLGALFKLLRNSMGTTTSRQKWFAYLCYMVVRIRDHQLTDMRDNIFAILGLVKRSFPLDTPDPFPVVVDYISSAELVYQRFSMLLIKELPVLTVLSLVEDIAFRSMLPNRPSWVPNYSFPWSPLPLSWQGLGGFYDASRITVGECVQHSLKDDKLILHGRRVSVVMMTCKPQRDMIRSRQLKPCLDLSDSMTIPYFHLEGQTKFEVVWRTMIANHGPPDIHNDEATGYPASPDVGTSFRACLVYWIAESLSKIKAGSPESRVFAFDHLSVQQLTGEKLWPEVEHMADRLRNARTAFIHNVIVAEVIHAMSAFNRAYDPIAQHRKLYLTEDGHLGLGPQSAKEDDEVWLIEGAQVPFILRRAGEIWDDTFTLVGETYVHGFMNGEMLEWDGIGARTEIMIQ